MKKGISVLLIAAALFGFYGGAVSLKDVLAAEDYWEKQGEKFNSDINKLEDGLNKLAEDREDYLDNLDAVEDGEEELADGEDSYVDGQKEYEQGEADYAAASGKLTDARATLASGRAALADGEEAVNGLTKLINGISSLLSAYSGTWKPAYDKLADGREQIHEGIKGAKDSLLQLAVFLDPSLQAEYTDAVTEAADDDSRQTVKDYKAFISSTNVIAKYIPVIQETVKAYDDNANSLLAALNNVGSDNLQFAGTVNDQEDNLKAFAEFISDSTLRSQYEDAVDAVSDAYITYAEAIKKNTDDTIKSMTEEYLDSDEGKAAVSQYMEEGKTQEEATELVKNAYVAAITGTVTEQETAKAAAEAQKDSTLTDGIETTLGGMTKIAAGLDEINESINGDSSALKNKLLPGLATFNKSAAIEAIDRLAEGQDTIADGIRSVVSAVLGNATLRAAVKAKLGSDAVTLLKTYRANPNLLNTEIADFAKFEAQMDTTPGFVSALTKAKGLLNLTKASALKTLASGKAALASGYRQYKSGLASYRAAPGKLADARQKLADGLQELIDGRAALAAGREKLSEYEDDEEQIRSRLAALMSTEPAGGLASILDRRNGDDDFELADGTLDTEDGLEAVEVGRGYQSDAEALIAKELTARTAGTAACLAAGVLAMIAAVLSLLKKNRGAAVLALIAAAAGFYGAFYGSGAGFSYTQEAGGTSGSTPWIAAGVIGCAAIVHAVINFRAGKEA